jgi:hypothetical protein
VLLTDRLVVGARYELSAYRIVRHFVNDVSFPSVCACILLSVRTTAVDTVHIVVRVFVVVSLFMCSSRIALVSYVICHSSMGVVTALGFEARKRRSIVLVITDLNTLI